MTACTLLTVIARAYPCHVASRRASSSGREKRSTSSILNLAIEVHIFFRSPDYVLLYTHNILLMFAVTSFHDGEEDDEDDNDNGGGLDASSSAGRNRRELFPLFRCAVSMARASGSVGQNVGASLTSSA